MDKIYNKGDHEFEDNFLIQMERRFAIAYGSMYVAYHALDMLFCEEDDIKMIASWGQALSCFKKLVLSLIMENEKKPTMRLGQ